MDHPVSKSPWHTARGNPAAHGGMSIAGTSKSGTSWPPPAPANSSPACSFTITSTASGCLMRTMTDHLSAHSLEVVTAHPPDNYIELHASSAFSFLEAASAPEAYIERALEINMP